ncbi:hypothetical protein [Variovorax paradoxus]|jgi:hypothetical protein|uniref:hypothetical protein n=1 Tax=Variovorax paradoxus TaxID=34073 RepID=UPI0029C8973D|nr:hypothetical protein [Variovorax paradoxus]WPH12103.1 hypothetical protein RZE77_17165 [Variovorax paradoxus]WPH18716.1 hypothetical protein RZE78_16970 [Variovorax paradoxus]
MIAFHSAPKGEFVAEVLEMAVMDRVGEAMRRALPLLPSEARSTVMAMLQPQALAIIAGTLVVWAGSHFFGVGEIVDIILLVVGFAALGMSVFSGASELTDFVEKAVNGRSDADLDQAAEHFAKAISLLGISAIQALLMRGAARTVIERGIPKVEPLPNVGTPPPAGNALRLSRPETLPGGSLGSTGVFGEISVARNQSLTEQRLTLFHELVHRYFSPRMGPLRQLRAQMSWSAYSRSALLRYLEEALAEGYGQLKVHGLAQALGAYRFPIQNGYVTVSQLAVEGMYIGRILIGGSSFWVGVSGGQIPNRKP